MHLTSARLLADEVKAELERLAASVESLERKKRDAFFDVWRTVYSISLQTTVALLQSYNSGLLQPQHGLQGHAGVINSQAHALITVAIGQKQGATTVQRLQTPENKHVIIAMSTQTAPQPTHMPIVTRAPRLSGTHPRRACGGEELNA
jgi:hypothetical protein